MSKSVQVNISDFPKTDYMLFYSLQWSRKETESSEVYDRLCKHQCTQADQWTHLWYKPNLVCDHVYVSEK